MHFSKIKKLSMTCALAASLVCSAALPLTVSATSATPSTSEAPGDPPSGEKPGEPPSGGGSFGGGANTTTFDYSGTYTGALIADGTSVDADQETYTATDSDQNAALAENGGILTILGAALEKSGDDSDGDRCNFYGVNAIALAVNEASTMYLSDSTLNATSEGSNAIFATDSATVYANNDTITTSADNSRGLDATYGGTIIANLMNISTLGNHCASIATDRGGGNISVANSTLSTAGSGSPLLYSTGDIQVSNVTGTATGSQIAGMEGLNNIFIYNSTLTSKNTATTASDPMANGIILYQSMSGDAETTTGETATFEASDSTLSSAIESGSMFYITNTSVNVALRNTILDFDSSKAALLTIQGNDSNSWGTAGSNGAVSTFTGLDQTLNGDISVDTISSLDLYLLENTTYTGATSITENAVNTSATEAPITVNIDSDSSWIVTGDSTVTNLNAEEGASIVDADGKTVSIIVDGSTVVGGDSSYTITVTGSYGTTFTTSDANTISGDYISRSDFDSYYGTSTSFDTLSASTEESSSEVTTETSTELTSEASADTTEVPSTDVSASTETTSSPTPIAITGAVVLVVLIGGGVFIYRKKKK